MNAISFIFFSSLITSQISRAQENPVGTSTAQISPLTAGPKKALSASAYLEYSEKIAKEQFGPKKRSTAIQVNLGYEWNEFLKSNSELTVNKDQFGQQETTVSDMKISTSINGYAISDTINTKHSISTVVPMSKNSVKRDRLQTSISLANGVKYINNYFSIGYTLSVAQNFHEFTQNAEGSPNIQNRLTQSVDLAVPITEKISVSTSGAYRIGRTYQNSTRYGFIFDLDANYEIVKSLDLNIGTSNEGNALKKNGIDSNISIYDENSSVSRAGLTYSY